MKKLVLILDSLDRMYPENNQIIGGANKVGRYLIDYFSSLKDVQLDIICGISNIQKPNNVNEIVSLGFDPFDNMSGFLSLAEHVIKKNNYDVVLTSDLFPYFGNIIVHSHTLMYKNKNCKTFLERIIQSFLRRKKIQNFKAVFKDKNRKIFTVSNRLSNDYVDNLSFEKDNVICVYPGVEQREKQQINLHKPFTFGIVAGNAINKGGYLFLFAVLLLKLMNKKFRAKMLIATSNRCCLINILVKLLNLSDKIEILYSPYSMEEFYKQIDCLVVPSINEAFGLVVTEAASYGKPSLVSNTAGSSEIITDTVDGFVFTRTSCLMKSLLSLYNKMLSVLQTDEKTYLEVSDKAYFLSQNFTWSNYAEKIAQALNLL